MVAESQVNGKIEYDLSVITVCRNAAAGLQRTLASVLWHKEHGSLSLEHILIDGSSTDGSAEMGAAAVDCGEIEQFISEPDAGIYDAMNKGIRLARGKVIFFLNCGDCFCKTDLRRFVAPILDGSTVAVAADDYAVGGSGTVQIIPTYEKRYLDTIVCHQGYFAATRLFEEFGDFDTSLTCIADAYFINLVIQKYGKPLIINEPVAYYLDGGYSCNARVKFVPEFVELRKRFWNEIEHLCAKDAEYRNYAVASVAEAADNVWEWMQMQGSPHLNYVSELRRQCRALRELRPGTARAFVLWWYEVVYLGSLRKNCSLGKICMKLRRYMRALVMPSAESVYVRLGLIDRNRFWRMVAARVLLVFGKKMQM